MIKMKPHHFLDIIKLYGSGITEFVPDVNYHHDFYRIANEVISSHTVEIELTMGEDDICKPCKYISTCGFCMDKIQHIQGVESKDEWNKTLDGRILKHLGVPENEVFTARDFCALLYVHREAIFDIWSEDTDAAKELRYRLFENGAAKYLE